MMMYNEEEIHFSLMDTCECMQACVYYRQKNTSKNGQNVLKNKNSGNLPPALRSYLWK